MSSLIVLSKKIITAGTQQWKVERFSAELEVRFEASRDDLLRNETYGSRLTCTRRSHADLRLLTSSRGRKSSIMRIPSVLKNILFIPQHSLFVFTIYSYVPNLLPRRFWSGFLVKLICCFSSPTTAVQFTQKYKISCLPSYLPVVHCYLYIITIRIRVRVKIKFADFPSHWLVDIDLGMKRFGIGLALKMKIK